VDNAAAMLCVVGLVGVGITGGTVFVFSNFMMRVLGEMPEPEGMRVMQSINRAVYNGAFMGGFGASVLVGGGSVAIGLIRSGEPWSVPVAIAGALYLFGVFLVTAAGNVPLNNALDRASHTDPEGIAFWRRYLVVWTRWNHLRAASSILSVVCFGVSLWLM